MIHRALGDRAQARRLLDDALSAMKSREHVDPEASVTILDAAARLAGEASDWRGACALLREQGQIQNGVLHEHLAILTETDRLRYVQTLMEEVWLAASAAATAGESVPELIDIAFRWTLQRKALVVQAEQAQRDAVMGGRYPALRAKFAALRQLREELGGLQLHGGSADRLAALSEEAEALERELVRAVPEMRLEKALQGADPSHVAQALPETACLIEFLRYRCYDWAGTQGAGSSFQNVRGGVALEQIGRRIADQLEGAGVQHDQPFGGGVTGRVQVEDRGRRGGIEADVENIAAGAVGDCLERAVEHEHVIPRSAVELIDAGTAIEHVRPRATLDSIVPRAAGQGVAAIAAGDLIGKRIAGSLAADRPGQRQVLEIRAERVVGRADDMVHPAPGER